MNQTELQPDHQSSPTDHKVLTHWPSFWQLVLSVLAILGLWGMALLLVLTVVATLLSGSNEDSLTFMLTAAGLAASGILLIPSAGYAYMRILGRPAPDYALPRHTGWWILALLPVVGLGHFIARADAVAWLLLPPLHVIAISLSVFWLLYLGMRGISLHSSQRTWGVFDAGLIFAPLFSLVAELVLFFAAAMVVGFYLARDPIIMEQLLELSENIPFMLDPSDAVIELLEPTLMQPWLIYAGLIGGAVLIPLIEELFKPIGVWLLFGREITPAQGFAAGLLSGAGYALFESFVLSANAPEEWSLIVIARIGTSLIHILTSGLMGLALVLAWREQRYLRLALTYLMAVVIHGLWNGLVILNALPSILPDDMQYPQFLRQVGFIAPGGLLFLIVSSFILLMSANNLLRRAIIPPARSKPRSAGAISDDKEDLTNGNH